jgi:hypothetical protein
LRPWSSVAAIYGPRETAQEGDSMSVRERLKGAWHWPRYRLLSRCWAEGCGRPMALHSPRAAYDCERTPMALSFTEKGLALLAEYDDENHAVA